LDDFVGKSGKNVQSPGQVEAFFTWAKDAEFLVSFLLIGALTLVGVVIAAIHGVIEEYLLDRVVQSGADDGRFGSVSAIHSLNTASRGSSRPRHASWHLNAHPCSMWNAFVHFPRLHLEATGQHAGHL
jgi:hypothetical protein